MRGLPVSESKEERVDGSGRVWGEDWEDRREGRENDWAGKIN